MFHWICPECGREIAPTVRECPVCDGGAEQAELVLAGVVEASARTVHLDVPARSVQGDVSGRNGSGDVSARGGRVEDGDPGRRSSSVIDALPKPAKWGRKNGEPAADREAPVSKPVQEVPAAKDSPKLVPADVRPPEPVFPPAAAEEAALIPEILDAKSAFDRMAEAKAANILGIRTQGVVDRQVASPEPEGRVNPAIASESRAITTRTLESRAVETRPVESRPVDARPVDSKPVDLKPIDSKPVDAKPVEARTVETRAAEGRVVESKPVEIKSIEPPAVQVSPAPPAEEPSALAPLPAPIDRVPLLAKLSRLAPPKIASSSHGKDAGAIQSEKKIDAARPEMPAADGQNPAANGAILRGGPDAKAGVTPEAATQEPVLPSFDSPALESLHSLVAAVGKLDEEMFDEVMPAAPPEADPPASGKLPLPKSCAGIAPGVPTIAGREAVAPEAAPPRSLEIVKLATPPVYEPEPVSPPLFETTLPLVRPQPQVMKSAALSQSAASVPPRAGAVRAPRSRPAFLAPRMARMVKYSPLAKRPIRPIPPSDDVRRSDTALRITLPGPMLTKALVSFQDRGLTPIFLEARAFRKRFAYGWLVMVLVVGTVLGVGLSTMIPPPPHPAEAKTSAEGKPADGATQDQASPAPVHATGSNPLSKVLEVTGFRIVMDPSRKAEVQYLVVNHSASRFSNATVYVTLQSADAHIGQPPLCRFSFAAPRLGPFEAKEMVSAIEKTSRPVNLPDWQDLRAEIEIGQ